jgi:cellulose synthase/poly-beta-1,6-N-acetylglucosamine synthase-like glycosyltransferase
MKSTRRPSPPEPDEWPPVTVIIAAHDEERVIAGKLENSLRLDYPGDKLQLVVAADGCTDRTVEIVLSFEKYGIEISEQKEHRGKTSALNQAVKNARGGIIIFSDANGMYRPETLRRLIRHFSDASVGCVCGNLVLTNPGEKDIGEGENLYWRYEKWIKRQESDFNSLIGANGSIFAIRRELYTPLDDDIIDDFTTPLLIYRKGYRVIYEEGAESFEESNENSAQGFSRKVRIILRQLVALKRYRSSIRPFSGVMGFQLVSHKLLRWLVPLWMIGIFIITLFICESPSGRLLMAFQVLFYGAALLGYLQERAGSSRSAPLVRIPFYFCMMNLAALWGLVKFTAGRTQPKWQIHR